MKLLLFICAAFYSTLAMASSHCAVGGQEQTALIARCEAIQVLRDVRGWGYSRATLELVKARYFDCRDGERIPGREFYATVETDGLMLGLDVQGDLDLGQRQKGTWSSEDEFGIYIRQKMKRDKDQFSVNYSKKNNQLRFVMRHRKLGFKKAVADVVFTCESLR